MRREMCGAPMWPSLGIGWATQVRLALQCPACTVPTSDPSQSILLPSSVFLNRSLCQLSHCFCKNGIFGLLRASLPSKGGPWCLRLYQIDIQKESAMQE
jgi:hypothetical protein